MSAYVASIFEQLAVRDCLRCGPAVAPSRPTRPVRLADGECAIQGTLTAADIGTPFARGSAGNFPGLVEDLDVGKRVYARLDTRILEMESTEQRDERVARGSSNAVSYTHLRAHET